MIRKASLIGIFGGFVIGIAVLYPMITLAGPGLTPQWVRPVQSEIVHTLLLMLSALIGAPFVLSLGVMAARKSEARGWQDGMKMGALAGVFASILSYLIWLLPLNALLAYSGSLKHLAKMDMAMDMPVWALQKYINIFNSGAYWVELLLAGFILFWAIEGAIVGAKQRGLPERKRPSLLHLHNENRPLSDWFSGDECANTAGIFVGLGVGMLLIFMMYSGFASITSAQEWIDLMNDRDIANPILNITATVSPLLMLLLPFFGVMVVLLMKSPPTVKRARFSGIMTASLTISGFLAIVVLRLLYFFGGLFPFIYFHDIGNDTAEITEAIDQIQMAMMSANVPMVLMLIVIILPWFLIFAAFITGVVMGIVEFLIFGLTVPLVHKKPVDQAARIVRQLMKQPKESMLSIYALFQQDVAAPDVLAHIAVQADGNAPALSHLAAALHTLGNPDAVDEQIDAIHATQSILKEHPDWRLSSALAEMSAALYAVFQARTLEQILEIDSPHPSQTSSLPPAIVKSVDLVGRVVMELDKVKKVDDLATQLIFLENALQLIHDAQRFVDVEATTPQYTKSPLPEMVALAGMFEHWQGIVLTAVKNLKGRADLSSNLQATLCARTSTLPIIIDITNSGLNVAQHAQIKLLPCENYVLGDVTEEIIEILSPGDTRQVQFTVAPVEDAERVRVAWEIVYNDAVDEERKLEFADMVEFTMEKRPFTRVFPIPYVTGTPLKTDSVFVGREDVFSFIQENLLGVHQNNVIILHGQRRTGKTSVLYRLGDVMRDTHYGVLIDMQGKPARGEADFLYSIADDIAYALEDHDIEIDLPPRESFEQSPEFFFRSRFLRDLHKQLGDKNLLLMFDEFEELQRRVENGRLQPEIFQFLRNLMQHEDRVDFVFSGTHKLEELGAEYWSILFNIAAYKPITFLSPSDMRRLIEEPVAQYHVEYDPLAVERLTAVTAGHPYFTQLALHEMMVLHNEMERSYLTVNDVNHALERIAERGEAHFKYIWSESCDDGRLVLRGLTELLVNAEAVPLKELQEYLHSRGHDSPDEWRTALQSLEGRDILTRQSAKSTLYRFKVDLIRLWIDKTRPSL